MPSPAKSVDTADLKEWGMNLLVVVVSAVLAWSSDYLLPQLQEESAFWVKLALVPAITALIEFGRKYFPDNSDKKDNDSLVFPQSPKE